MAAPDHPTVEILTEQWNHYASTKGQPERMSLSEFTNYLLETRPQLGEDPELINRFVDNANDHPDSAKEITLEEFIEFVHENWDRLLGR